MATAPAAAASPHHHGSDHGDRSGAAHAAAPDSAGRHSWDRPEAAPAQTDHGRSEQWSARPADGHHSERNTWHRSTESHENGRSGQTNSAVSHGVVAQSVQSAPTAVPSPVPAAASHPGHSSGSAHPQDGAGAPAGPVTPAAAPVAHLSAPAPKPAPAPSAPAPAPSAPAPAAAGPNGPATAGDHAAGLVGTAPALVSSGLFVPLRVPVVTAVVTAAPSPIPARFFGAGSANRAGTTPAPAATPPQAPAPAAQAAPPILPGAFGEPMVVARGAWRGLSLQAATDLRIPIGMLVAVALFLLVQALVDRRDPKVSGAPEHGTDETIGFQ